jgi:subtilase family serine protease
VPVFLRSISAIFRQRLILVLPFLLAATAVLLSQSPLRPSQLPAAIAASRRLAELPRAATLHLSLGLPLRNQSELDRLLADLADPASPRFRQFLTPAQFADQFGPSADDYRAVIRFAEANHLTVTATYSNRLVLSVSGAAADIESALQVKLSQYQHPTRGEFFAPDREPTLPPGLNVLDIAGLDNFTPPRPMNLTRAELASGKPFVTGSGPAGYFIGKDFRAAYAPGVTLTGAGQTVGLLEFDGYFPADETANFAQAGLPAVPTQTILLDGLTGSAGGDNIEVILDIMMASYMAPGLNKIIVYEGGNPNDLFNRMATDNLAQQLSSSWGFGINATTEQIFKQFIAQGQSILQASGDSGSYANGIMPPSDDPSVTVVGGTSLVTSGPGGAWQSESTWSGSGGGVSTTYPIPAWQVGHNIAAAGGSATMRNTPDVALTADIQMYLICNNGQQISVGGTSAAAPLWAGFIALANQQAGTARKPSVGFLNPPLYTIGGSGAYAAGMHDIVSGSNGGFKALPGYDLTTGWGSPAGQPLIYDLSGTSAGPTFTLTPSASTLALHPSSTISTTIAIGFQNSFSGAVALAVTGLPAGVTASFGSQPTATTAGTSSLLTLTSTAAATVGTSAITITGTSGALKASAAVALSVVTPSFTLTPASAAITVSRPNSASTAIAVNALNGFTGTVALALSTTLPAGVTSTFTQATASAPAAITFAVASSAATGAYPLTLTGTSGALKATTSITLTVVTPSFTLASSAATVTISRPGSGSTFLNVSEINGLTGNVALTLGTLPAGVTASFGTASTSTQSTLTLTAASTTAAGTYPVTVNGVSGALKASTTFNLSVVIPSFNLSFVPGTLAVPRGSSASGSANIASVNGFSGKVTLTATGMPAGVSLLLGTATSTAIPVTFGALPTTVAGSYPVTLNASSGTLTSSARLTLTVIAPQVGTAMVNLAAYYNINAIDADSLAFPGGGIDGGLNGTSEAYSSTLLGVQQTVAGTSFYFGPSNALDAVSGQTVPLPAGQFSSLQLLATAVNGGQAAQTFKISYTDGTSTTLTQSLSDWFSPAGYPGETRALTMAYRDTGGGLIDHRTFYLYGYNLALNPAKTVANVTFPSNRNVVILAATLTGATASTH